MALSWLFAAVWSYSWCGQFRQHPSMWWFENKQSNDVAYKCHWFASNEDRNRKHCTIWDVVGDVFAGIQNICLIHVIHFFLLWDDFLYFQQIDYQHNIFASDATWLNVESYLLSVKYLTQHRCTLQLLFKKNEYDQFVGQEIRVWLQWINISQFNMFQGWKWKIRLIVLMFVSP